MTSAMGPARPGLPAPVRRAAQLATVRFVVGGGGTPRGLFGSIGLMAAHLIVGQLVVR